MPYDTLSVIIPHYGDIHHCQNLVQELLGQSLRADEIIVVDDCSPVPAPELAGCTVIRRKSNGGFGAACNTGAAAASGDLLLFLNSDLHVQTNFVADLVQLSVRWMPAITGPGLKMLDGSQVFSARHRPTPLQSTIEWISPLKRWRSNPMSRELVGQDTRAAMMGTATPTDWLLGAALLIPCTEFTTAGGFDERFYMNSEEADLQRRLAQRGLPRVHIPNVCAEHQGGGSSDIGRRIDWVITSRLRYFDKWGGLNRMRVGMTAATLVNGSLDAARKLAGRNVTPVATTRNHLALIWKDFS